MSYFTQQKYNNKKLKFFLLVNEQSYFVDHSKHMSGLMHRMKQVTLSSKSLLTTKYSDHIQSLSKLVSHRFSYMMQHATMSNVAHVTIVSSIVYSMYQSMSLMTEIFLYDAKAGIRGMVDREETAQKIDHQLR